MNEATKKVYNYVTDAPHESLLRYVQGMIAYWSTADYSDTWIRNAPWTLVPGDQLAERILGSIALTESNPPWLRPEMRAPIALWEFDKVEWDEIILEIKRQDDISKELFHPIDPT